MPTVMDSEEHRRKGRKEGPYENTNNKATNAIGYSRIANSDLVYVKDVGYLYE